MRSPQEYERAHLPGAVNVPFDKIVHAEECHADPAIERIVVCQSGYRAAIAASLLLAGGCRKASVLSGGMNAVGDE